MAFEADVLTSDTEISLLHSGSYRRIALSSPTERQIALLADRVTSIHELSITDPLYNVSNLARTAYRLKLRVSRYPEFVITTELLSFHYESLVIEGENEASSHTHEACSSFAVEYVGISDYPLIRASIESCVLFWPFLSVLRLKPVSTRLEFLETLLECRELSEVALPVLENSNEDILCFVSRLLENNARLESVETSIGVFQRRQMLDLGEPLIVRSRCAAGIEVLVHSPQERKEVEASDADEPPEMDVNLVFFGNEANGEENEQYPAREPLADVFDRYREVALAGFMAYEASLGLCCVRLAPEGAKLQFTKCPFESSKEIYEFLLTEDTEPDAWVNFDAISDCGLGDSSSPISHNAFWVSTRKQRFDLKLTTSPSAMWIEEQDLFVVLLELIRFYEGKPVLYANIARKYARRKIAQ